MEARIELRPIGRIAVEGNRHEVLVDEAWRPALEGLGDFSHVLVLWWLDRNDSAEARSFLASKKPYTRGPDRLGVFATRSPFRPNPVAVTVARILSLDAASGRILLDYIDAAEGSPLLDLKPYQPCADRVRDAAVPAWCAHWPSSLEGNAGFDWAAEFNF